MTCSGIARASDTLATPLPSCNVHRPRLKQRRNASASSCFALQCQSSSYPSLLPLKEHQYHTTMCRMGKNRDELTAHQLAIVDVLSLALSSSRPVTVAGVVGLSVRRWRPEYHHAPRLDILSTGHTTFSPEHSSPSRDMHLLRNVNILWIHGRRSTNKSSVGLAMVGRSRAGGYEGWPRAERTTTLIGS